MDIYLARQPVFDRKKDVYGYELLYRFNTLDNKFNDTDEDHASSTVMVNNFHVAGIDKITDGKKAFINFTANLLKLGVATLFPRETLVVEVLETVKPGLDIVEQCRELKKLGYSLALDDFAFSDAYAPLMELADIIKVDFLKTGSFERKNIIRRCSNKRAHFLAEKIETDEAYEEAREAGYHYFQGYFFSKPVILSISDIPSSRMNYIELIRKVNSEDIDFNELAQIVSRDISLAYKLLRLVNSAAFGFRRRIESVHHAMVILGTREIRKWVSLIALRGLGEGKPDEITRLTLVRAKLAENLSAGLPGVRSEELFLAGLFSTLDVLLGRPMKEIIEEIPVAGHVKSALVYRKGAAGQLLDLICSYERGEWDKAFHLTDHLGLDRKQVSQAFVNAAEWTSGVFNPGVLN